MHLCTEQRYLYIDEIMHLCYIEISTLCVLSFALPESPVCGVLQVHILNSEGHPGYGVDIRSRAIWQLYPETTRLKVRGRVLSGTPFPAEYHVTGSVSCALAGNSRNLKTQRFCVGVGRRHRAVGDFVHSDASSAFGIKLKSNVRRTFKTSPAFHFPS